MTPFQAHCLWFSMCVFSIRGLMEITDILLRIFGEPQGIWSVIAVAVIFIVYVFLVHFFHKNIVDGKQ